MKIEAIRDPDRIVNYWKAQKPVVAAILFFGLSFNISMSLAPVWQGKLIDAIAQSVPFRELLFTAAAFVVLVAGIQVLRYFKRFYIRRFANGTSASMRLMIYRNIMGRPLGELAGETTGNLMTRAVSDVDLCVEGMRKFTTELFDTGVLLAAYIATLFVYDARITLVSIVSVPLAMLLAEKLKKTIYKYTVEWRKKNGAIADYAWNSVENIMLYRVKGLEGDIVARYGIELEDLRRKAVRASILENSMQPVYNVIAMLGVLPVITLGGGLVLSGGWTVGDFSAYITIYVAMAFKASKASKLFNSVQKSTVSWKRIKPYLGDSPAVDAVRLPEADVRAGGSDPAARPDAIRGPRLSVADLSLRYPGSRSDAIAGISFEGNAGGIVGVTGPVACGKSSLALALAGLYQYDGSVRIDGRELSSMSGAERAECVSYQGHRSELLSDTIYANITLGAGGDVSGVLRDVAFDKDLVRMPDGIDTRVGSSGVRLSGGQQSRIALARALYGKKKLIVLDDPFSAVDVKTEETIIENIRTGYPESLIVLISHRLTIFPKADSIVLLHGSEALKDATPWNVVTPQGLRRVEYGTHESLMRDSSLYRAIYCLQSASACEVQDERA